MRGRPCVRVCSREGQKRHRNRLGGGDVKKGPSHRAISTPNLCWRMGAHSIYTNGYVFFTGHFSGELHRPMPQLGVP